MCSDDNDRSRSPAGEFNPPLLGERYDVPMHGVMAFDPEQFRNLSNRRLRNTQQEVQDFLLS